MANLLIVDDELGMRQFLTHLFQREGHVVRVAENGHAALEQMFDLIGRHAAARVSKGDA